MRLKKVAGIAGLCAAVAMGTAACESSEAGDADGGRQTPHGFEIVYVVDDQGGPDIRCIRYKESYKEGLSCDWDATRE